MTRTWWIPILQWVFWGLVMSLVMSWVAKSRIRTRPDTETRTLAHPRSTLVIGIVGVVFAGGLAILSNTVWKNSTSTVWTTLIFVGFACLCASLILGYFFERH